MIDLINENRFWLIPALLLLVAVLTAWTIRDTWRN